MSVHSRHCCVDHGCKYGDPLCPVVAGVEEQEYPCEDCSDPEYIQSKKIKELITIDIKMIRKFARELIRTHDKIIKEDVDIMFKNKCDCKLCKEAKIFIKNTNKLTSF